MTDCCSTPGLTPFDDALGQLLAKVEVMTRTTTLPIEEALGRVLSKSVVSNINIPAADNSAMDGFAVRIEDAVNGAQLEQVAKVFAGHPFDGVIGMGQCARIMTGGQVPAGCDAVVMQENTLTQDNIIIIEKAVRSGENIRRAGEDIAQGQIVLGKGRCLTPADIGLLASLGFSHVTVFAPIKVALMSTGDELQTPGKPLNIGQFYESNGYTVGAVLQRFGVELMNFGIIEDDINALKRAFTQADAWADVVITSGGVSVGEADYTKTVLEELGRIYFWKLAIKPGKPFAFGFLPDSYFIGLPGNPVSALVTLHQLAIPLLRKISGQEQQPPLRLKAVAATNIRKQPGRMDFQRGVYQLTAHGELIVQLTGSQGSGMLTSMSRANCYIVLEQDRGSVQAGDTVMIEPFDRLLL
ncbi:molybdopterin molybdotransferase MoeA [Oceaniserpentilla sp. 4NH20-0058]|uniref:molybdopterin molybdotransferase MoeA n=1 Tax=Oceaniserpentilla sp. 4NH20-0058 TaxID=3127660 RepID=UPI00333E6D8D